ncbi:MAG: hypothetical protein L3J71_04245 [Victivallaceae bacterium]|nr:hypothetical protein [Victivallaceae bacterium]
MAQEQDYGGIITAVIIVIGVVFSIVQALLKGKNNREPVFKPNNKQVDTNFIEFEDEPMMVVDAQGNIIRQSMPKPPAPPMKNRRRKCPAVDRETARKKLEVGTKTTVCEAEYQPSGSYIDFIRTHANSAVIMHEILGKPKALQ